MTGGRGGHEHGRHRVAISGGGGRRCHHCGGSGTAGGEHGLGHPAQGPDNGDSKAYETTRNSIHLHPNSSCGKSQIKTLKMGVSYARGGGITYTKDGEDRGAVIPVCSQIGTTTEQHNSLAGYFWLNSGGRADGGQPLTAKKALAGKTC